MMAGEGQLSRRHTWRTTSRGLTAAIVLAAVTSLLSGCLVVQRAPDGSLSIATGTPEQVREREQKTVDKTTADDGKPHPDATAPAEVGSQFTTGSWQVSVTSVKPHKKMSNGQKPSKGNILIYVNVKVKNVGSTTDLTVWPRQFWLTDSAGKKVPAFETSLKAFNAQQVRPVQIGMGAHTTFVYEVPKGSDGYIFHFKKRKASPTVYRWQLQLAAE